MPFSPRFDVRGTLPADGVDLWYARTDSAAADAAAETITGWLSDDERARSRRFVFAPDARRYVLAHGLLRLAFSHYLGNEPRACTFRSGEFGKPQLADPPVAGMEFNLSHTFGLAACAFTGLGAIGIDVETASRGFSILDLAPQFCTPGERARLSGLDRAQAEERALVLWTLKEAFVKALGLGLQLAPDTFEISTGADEPARLTADATIGGSAADWHFARLRLDGARLAVAVRSRDRTPPLLVRELALSDGTVAARSLDANQAQCWEV